MEQKTTKGTNNNYKISGMRLDALRKINKELDELYELKKLDPSVIDFISNLREINSPMQHLVYANSILNYMKILKES